MTDTVKDVYSFLIPMIENSLLLPNATVAEIVPFMNVDLAENAESSDDWQIGQIIWRNIKIPVVSLERIQGKKDLGELRRSRIAIVYTLNSNQDVPYVAIMVQGIPRLVPVDEDNGKMLEEELPTGVKAWVDLDGRKALIPDLDLIENMLVERV
ncbi:chemotaxis protein CheW [Kangiella koreensis]|uniref:CheW domain protein n=1 Tax=Kangiella koreensis (strain DSM 16069 / JCM 12317 / KCTC 12182 / SW-125) TaxID=523791 RepID=C7R7A4_KANKD|nr:chemotaxis protein CheW [Kangiella koreensis]ACV25653.1 CheW domain protein [Kangiella koreensis DSM 16069]